MSIREFDEDNAMSVLLTDAIHAKSIFEDMRQELILYRSFVEDLEFDLFGMSEENEGWAEETVEHLREKYMECFIPEIPEAMKKITKGVKFEAGIARVKESLKGYHKMVYIADDDRWIPVYGASKYSQIYHRVRYMIESLTELKEKMDEVRKMEDE